LTEVRLVPMCMPSLAPGRRPPRWPAALPGTPQRWLLLTGSADRAAPVDLIRLRAQEAQAHRCGTLVPLPPSRLESGVVTWHIPPALDGPTLPLFTAVVAVIQAVTTTAALA
jgi:hypothetical protein